MSAPSVCAMPTLLLHSVSQANQFALRFTPTGKDLLLPFPPPIVPEQPPRGWQYDQRGHHKSALTLRLLSLAVQLRNLCVSDLFGVKRHGSSDLKCVFIDTAS